MKYGYMVLTGDRISVQLFSTRLEAESYVKEKTEYHGDGRRFCIEPSTEPETIRDIISLCGVATQDRRLTVNGRRFTLMKTDDTINLVEVKAAG